MGLFSIDPAKRAERKRRRAERKAARAAAAEAKAASFETAAGDEENATLIAADKNGRQVQQNVKLNKRGSRQRNARIAALEKENAELKVEVEGQNEEIEALTERVDRLEKHLNRRSNTSFLLSRQAMRAVSGLVRIVNVRDRIVNPGALMLAEGLKVGDALGLMGKDDEDVPMGRDVAGWLEVGATLLTAYAYYDPEEGLSSIFQTDRAAVVDAGKGDQGNP